MYSVVLPFDQATPIFKEWHGVEETPGCRHCEDRPKDTVEHTVVVYPVWAEERSTFIAAISGDLSRPALASTITRSESTWGIVSSRN